jgi:peptidoglycan/xylan/chitin deacetylase (PgdA/CDA1 family)
MKAAWIAVLTLAAAWALAAVLAGAGVPRHVLIPILMYHTSSEEEPLTNAELHIKPSVFREQMTWLLENGYTFCTFDDFPRLGVIRKPVMVTFDDGYPENYTEIFPIVRELGIKITVFVFNETPLPPGMMREMAASGLVFFESHGETHRDMTSLDKGELRGELLRSKAWIEEVTGRIPAALAYPYGLHSAAVRRAARTHFRYGAAVGGRTHSTAQNPFAVQRYSVPRSMGMEEFIWIITAQS